VIITEISAQFAGKEQTTDLQVTHHGGDHKTLQVCLSFSLLTSKPELFGSLNNQKMASNPPTSAKKRRRVVDGTLDSSNAILPASLDLPSDQEEEEDEGGSPSSDDDRVDEFPALDPDSDTSEDDDVEDAGSQEGMEGEEQSSDEESEDHHIFPKAKHTISKITGHPKIVYPPIEPEYDSDSSTEDVRDWISSTARSPAHFQQNPNRVGNIPLHWYDDLPHLGYTVDGKKVLRPAKGDELDKFLATVDDPSSWSVVTLFTGFTSCAIL
jgi:ribosome biogenesis protein ERB1